MEKNAAVRGDFGGDCASELKMYACHILLSSFMNTDLLSLIILTKSVFAVLHPLAVNCTPHLSLNVARVGDACMINDSVACHVTVNARTL